MRKRADPIPEEFASYEAAAEFWGSHDTTDYPHVFRTVKVVSSLQGCHHEIEIDPDVVKDLQARARQKRVRVRNPLHGYRLYIRQGLEALLKTVRTGTYRGDGRSR